MWVSADSNHGLEKKPLTRNYPKGSLPYMTSDFVR